MSACVSLFVSLSVCVFLFFLSVVANPVEYFSRMNVAASKLSPWGTRFSLPLSGLSPTCDATSWSA